METSVGHGWQKGPRNSPTVLNAVLNEAQFWDGRADDLAAQAKGPMQAGVEMANTPEAGGSHAELDARLCRLVHRRLPGEADPPSFRQHGQGDRGLRGHADHPAPFDAWLNGDDNAMTADAKAGLAAVHRQGLFVLPFGRERRRARLLPLRPDRKARRRNPAARRQGPLAVTETVDDEYVFRASPLRNIALTAPYFHSGKVWDLAVAVEIMAESQLGEELAPEETAQIVAFLKA
jgi:cytochrome c peroxidase